MTDKDGRDSSPDYTEIIVRLVVTMILLIGFIWLFLKANIIEMRAQPAATTQSAPASAATTTTTPTSERITPRTSSAAFPDPMNAGKWKMGLSF